MDITRNWRLKTSRSQLMAARHPETGAIMLPQQTPLADDVVLYTFETETAVVPLRVHEDEASYARAAR